MKPLPGETQRSEAWFEERLGILTASIAYDCTAKKKDGSYYSCREDRLYDKAIERLTGKPVTQFVTPAMQWGIDHEDEARIGVEIRNGITFDQVGLIKHPTYSYIGASPDGLRKNGGLEIKCPSTRQHIETMETGIIKPEYVDQMMLGMMCTGKREWLFASYDPRLPDDLKLWVKVIEFDEKRAAYLEEEALKFLKDLDNLCHRLVDQYPVAKAAYEQRWA